MASRNSLTTPWSMRVILLIAVLGIALTLFWMLRMQTQIQVDCETQRDHNWHTMPVRMSELQHEADARRVRTQRAIDVQRAASWWSWLVLPATLADPGCQTMPF